MATSQPNNNNAPNASESSNGIQSPPSLAESDSFQDQTINAEAVRRYAWKANRKYTQDVGQLVCEAISTGDWPPQSRADITRLYQSFIELGNINHPRRSFEYGLSLFKEARTIDAVITIIDEHKSLGDFPRQRLARIEEWRAMSLESRQIENEQRNCEAEQLVNETFQDSRGTKLLKDLKGAQAQDLVEKLAEFESTSSEGRTFQGVNEKMRSSWEALFAKVVNQRKDLFYMYEPLGFPIYLPGSQRVTAYHPDFIVFRRFEDGSIKPRIIEIKGRVYPEGRQKIELFRKFYIHGDFSALSPDDESAARTVTQAGKYMCMRQCLFQPDETTQFRVFGNKRWLYNDSNGNADVGFATAGSPGVIPRLAQLHPDLVPENFDSFEHPSPPSNDNQTLEKSPTKNQPSTNSFAGPRIQRSDEMIVVWNPVATGYNVAKAYDAILKLMGMENRLISTLSLSNIAITWHTVSQKEKDDYRALYPDNRTPLVKELKNDKAAFSDLFIIVHFLHYLYESHWLTSRQYKKVGQSADAAFSDLLANNARSLCNMFKEFRPESEWKRVGKNPCVLAFQKGFSSREKMLNNGSAAQFEEVVGIDRNYIRQQIIDMSRSGKPIDFSRIKPQSSSRGPSLSLHSFFKSLGFS